jgi:hypothetical protein
MALRSLCAAALGLAAAAGATPASAQDAVFGPQTLHGMAELRVAAADGERSWVDGGFGKAAVPGAGWRAKAGVSQAVLQWKPRFSFAVGAVVSAQWQDDVHPKLDLDEAYLKLKAPPSRIGRLSARLGYFYPPVSLEHEGIGWTTTDLLSASALNSWIGEEAKVGGLEASYAARLGDHEVTATGALFGWNDTSGTLASFRGWSMHGLRAGVRTEFELPPLTPFMTSRQAGETYPAWEIDHRVGWYGKVEWRPPAPVALSVFHYDNRGDRIGVRDGQWAWETRFTTLSAAWSPDSETKVRAQALIGRTWMGYPFPEVWVDVGFSSAYLMGVRDVGPGALSARFDVFEARDKTRRTLAAADESGWALAGGWRQPLTGWADLFLEAQRIESKRPGRSLAGDAAEQTETVLQSAVRLHF